MWKATGPAAFNFYSQSTKELLHGFHCPFYGIDMYSYGFSMKKVCIVFRSPFGLFSRTYQTGLSLKNDQVSIHGSSFLFSYFLIFYKMNPHLMMLGSLSVTPFFDQTTAFSVQNIFTETDKKQFQLKVSYMLNVSFLKSVTFFYWIILAFSLLFILQVSCHWLKQACRSDHILAGYST